MMKILHTSDWHVGKTMRGASRIAEHEAVLDEIVSIAHAEAVDVVLIPGDLYDSAAPTPEAERVVYKALLGLHDTGAEIVVLAGNHDNAWAFEAIRPLFAELGVTMLGHVCAPDTGAVTTFTTRGGERLRLALLPFCSQRYSVKAAELMKQDAATNSATYSARLEAIIATLTASFTPDAVNVVLAHCMVTGGVLGGGERDAQTIFEYALRPTAFPATAHYVALGHLHRTQQVPGGCPIWYCGSPVHVDFGEENDTKAVLIVEAEVTRPARVREVPLSSPRGLRTLRGSVSELTELAGTTGEDFLRIFVREPARVGLADEIRELFPLAVDVIVDNKDNRGAREENSEPRRTRSPHELFADFLDERSIADDRLTHLFAELLDEATAP